MYGEFASLSFPKKGSYIKEKARVMLDANKRVIDEKASEIKAMCKEYNLNMVDLLTDLDTLRGHSSKQVASREMAKLQKLASQERDKLQKLASQVDELKKEIEKLDLIVRNLPDNAEYNLTFEELKYFGF